MRLSSELLYKSIVSRKLLQRDSVCQSSTREHVPSDGLVKKDTLPIVYGRLIFTQRRLIVKDSIRSDLYRRL